MKKYLLFTLISCSSVTGLFAQKELKNLKKAEIKEIELVVNTEVIIPGKELSIGVKVKAANGDVGTTSGLLAGKIAWKFFEVKIEGVKYKSTKAGEITISSTQSEFTSDEVKITVVLLKDESVKAELVLPVSYAYAINYYCYGRSGSSGSTGRNGSYNAGGDGRASKGERGERGSRGPSVEVVVTSLEATKKGHVGISIKLNNDEDNVDHLIMDPKGGTFTIYARGGTGGRGGSGGRGDANGSKCIVSNGADGGDGGDGGPGGSITFVLDTETGKYKALLKGVTSGGNAGSGGTGGSGGSSHSCTNSDQFTGKGGSGHKGQKGQRGTNGEAPIFIVK